MEKGGLGRLFISLSISSLANRIRSLRQLLKTFIAFGMCGLARFGGFEGLDSLFSAASEGRPFLSGDALVYETTEADVGTSGVA